MAKRSKRAGMIKLYFLLEKIWFNHIGQKIRFLLVGGFNTVVAYLIFTALYFLTGHRYLISVIIQCTISINISIITMRYYVFRSHGRFLKEYCKAAGFYAYMLFFNMAWLFIFIETLHIHALISQALYLCVSTVLTFLCHKYFSFRQPKSDNSIR